MTIAFIGYLLVVKFMIVVGMIDCAVRPKRYSRKIAAWYCLLAFCWPLVFLGHLSHIIDECSR